MNSLPASVQRFIAIVLLALLAILLAYLINPLFSLYSVKYDEAQRQADKLIRYRTLIAREELIDKQLLDLSRDEIRGQLFLKGNKISIAAASMQNFINQVVRDSGGQLISTQEYQPENRYTGLVPVGLNIQISGETGNLVKLLHQIELAKPLIFIEQLTIHSTSRRIANQVSQPSQQRRRNTRQWNRGPRQSLTIRMNIVSYLAEK